MEEDSLTDPARTSFDFPETARKARTYYGWWILTASFVGVGVVNGVSFWSFGLFIEPLEEQFGWTRAAVSLGVSLSLLAAGIAGPIVGWLIDRKGPRLSIFIGIAGTAGTYLLLATTDAQWQWYLFMALNGCFRTFIFLVPFMALTSRWFVRRRSVAIAITGTGLMVGAVVLVPIVRILIDTLEWDGAFVVISIVLVAVLLPLALVVIRNDPPPGADTVALSEGAPLASAPVSRAGVTLGQALRTSIFWVITLGFTLYAFAMVAWIVHSVPFYESVGISPGWAAALTSMTAGFAIFSRLGAGLLADRLRKLEYGGALINLLIAVAFAVLLVDTSPVAIAVFLTLFVISFGSGGALLQALVLTRIFGVAHFATIYGVVTVAETVGMLIGPTASGAIFDATGEYDLAIVMVLTVFGCAGLLFLLATRLSHAMPEPAPQHLSSEATP